MKKAKQKTQLKAVAVLTISLFLGTSCEKTPECETNKTGTLSFTNNASVSRKFWVDGAFKTTLLSGGKMDVTLNNGSHTWETSEITITNLDNSVDGCFEHDIVITECKTTTESCSE